MANKKKGGLGKGLDELLGTPEEQARRTQEAISRIAAAEAAGQDVLIPSGENFAEGASDFSTGRNDGLDIALAQSQAASVADPDFGRGWEVIDPAPTRNLGRSRAQKAAYNARLMILVIVMRDGSWIRYDGVYPNEWIALQNATSTNDFIDSYLYAHTWRKTNKGQLPPTPLVPFAQGTAD